MAVTFALLSRTRLAPQASLAPIAAAIELQLNMDFAPRWTPEVDYTVTADPNAEAKLALSTDQSCVVTLVDAEYQPGDAGWHSAAGANPYATIQVQDCGGDLPAVIAHECLETAADWRADMWSPAPHGPDLAREICDPVAELRCTVLGLRLAEFVSPEWFTGGGAEWPVSPGCLSPGGYALRRDGSTMWGSAMPDRKLPPRGRAAMRMKAVRP